MTDEDVDSPDRGIISDIHTGVNDVDDETPLDVEEDEEYDFQLEPEPIFNRLASQIYERRIAGAREALTNAVTSVLRAKRRGHIDDGEEEVRFDVYRGGDAGTDYLTIRDNGMGMSLEEIANVVSVIGATTVRDDGELAGQFGMGFLALFKLCGLKESFVMHSNSRLTDNGPFSGIWNAKRFTHDTNGEIRTALSEDEYGVQFDFELADSIAADDFIQQLHSIAQYARVPVTLTEYDPSGNVVQEKTLGGRALTDGIDDDALYIEYEDQYVHAVASKDSLSSETLLLDVPVSRGYHFRFDFLPWRYPNVLVRLKDEKGIIVDGPNEGKMVANAREYEAMSSEGISEGFIRETELDDDDIAMPRPIGSRDRLDDNEAFWQWLSNRLDEAYKQQLQSTTANLSDVSDIHELDSQSYKLFSNRLPEPDVNDDASFNDYYDPDTYDDQLEDVFGRSFGQLAESLNLLACPLPTVTLGASDASSASNHSDRMLIRTAWDAYGSDSDGEVYMGVTINNDRAAVVWDDNTNNRIVALPSADWYDALENKLEFQYLKNVKQSTLEEFDITDEVRERFLDDTDNKATTYRNSDITLHFGRNQKRSQTRNITIELHELLDAVPNEDGRYALGGFTPHTVVGFPRRGEYNLSERKARLSCEDIAVTSFTQPQWELAKEHSAVVRIDEYIEAARETTFQTSIGQQTLASYDNDAVLLFHGLPDETAPLFQTDHMMDQMVSVLSNDEWATDAYGWGVDAADVVYAPVSERTLRKLWPVLDEYDAHVLASAVQYARDDPGTLVTGPLDATLYVLGQCPTLRQTNAMKVIETGLERGRTELSSERDVADDVIEKLEEKTD